jgi:hypothetical protein
MIGKMQKKNAEGGNKIQTQFHHKNRFSSFCLRFSIVTPRQIARIPALISMQAKKNHT